MAAGTEQQILQRSDSGAVTTLTLNRPAQRNALSTALMSALQTELTAIAADRAIKVVIIAGNGPGFCAGHDLRELRARQDEGFFVELFAQCSVLMQQIVHLPQPVIARVHGIATAAGCQLVASCDLAIASETARFATPGVNIGLFCSTPMVALSRNVGRKQAIEMLLTGEMIDAARAVDFGLINRHVAAARLDEEIKSLAEQIASKSAYTVRVGKRAFYEQLERDLAGAYEFTAAVMVKNMLAADAAEGIDAFLDKRKPQWHDG